jgi:molybdate transport system substrate-binding protein
MGKTITVFAPSALTEAIKQLGADFEAKQGDVKVQFEVGHTPTQRTQIEQGATPDVILAAGRNDIDALAEQSLIAPEQVKPLARNQLIIVVPPDNPANITTVEDLARPGVRLLIAEPDLPVGMATQKLLENLNGAVAPDFKEKALANVVSRELGVKPIVSKIALGEADAGIVYLTDATAAPELTTLAIPKESNVTVAFVVAPLAGSANPEMAKAFVDYVLSDEAQALLHAQGFLPAAP